MPFEHVISGNIEALEQGIELLNGITDEQYRYVAEPYVSSSIGGHFRHILDMFKALANHLSSPEISDNGRPLDSKSKSNVHNILSFVPSKESIVDCVDYDQRRRGHSVEVERTVALAELKETLQFMNSMRCDDSKDFSKANQKLKVKTEVTLNSTHSVFLTSSVLRELIFVSSHAIHHYAVITIIAKLQGIRLGEYLGMAPATVSYLRDLKDSDCANANRTASE